MVNKAGLIVTGLLPISLLYGYASVSGAAETAPDAQAPNDQQLIELERVTPEELGLTPDRTARYNKNEADRRTNINNTANNISPLILKVAKDMRNGSDDLNKSVRSLQQEINTLYQLFENEIALIPTSGEPADVAYPLLELSTFMAHGGGIFANTSNLNPEDQEAIVDFKSFLRETVTPDVYGKLEREHAQNVTTVRARDPEQSRECARPDDLCMTLTPPTR